jgi:hypothetical protein
VHTHTYPGGGREIALHGSAQARPRLALVRRAQQTPVTTVTQATAVTTVHGPTHSDSAQRHVPSLDGFTEHTQSLEKADALGYEGVCDGAPLLFVVSTAARHRDTTARAARGRARHRQRRLGQRQRRRIGNECTRRRVARRRRPDRVVVRVLSADEIGERHVGKRLCIEVGRWNDREGRLPATTSDSK